MLIALTAFCVSIQASKTEDILSAENAKLTAANAELAASLKKRTAGTSSTAKAVDASSRTIATGNADVAEVTRKVAEDAKLLAERNDNDARQAAENAARERAEQRGRTQEMERSGELREIFGFLAILAGFLYNAFTASRDRRWARLDAREHQAVVLAKVDVATDAAKAAYTEANSVNRKIVEIGLQAKDGLPLAPEKGI